MKQIRLDCSRLPMLHRGSDLGQRLQLPSRFGEVLWQAMSPPRTGRHCPGLVKMYRRIKVGRMQLDGWPARVLF